MSQLRPNISPSYLNNFGDPFLPGYLGIEIIDVKQGVVTGHMPIKSYHMAPNGFLHAGAIVTLADTCCGFATVCHLPKGAQSFTTIELKSNHLSTLRDGVLFCEAKAQHMGQSTHVWDAIVSDEATGKKLALFRCSQMILWPKS